MKVHTALLLASLCAGCAAEATHATPSLAPRRPVIWQQFCEQAWSVPQASAMATARGAEGWELVTMYNGVLCYKRPAPGPEVFGSQPDPRWGPRPQTPGSGDRPDNPVPAVRDPGF
jgi:hypothetical protein